MADRYAGHADAAPASGRTPDRLDRPFGDALVRRLFPPLATGVHWGLERPRNALAALGDPHRSYAVLHVGGTNGKGSVAKTLAAILRAAGRRVACYTSPHLCSFRERYTVEGEALSEETLALRAEEVRDVVLRFGLTFFEAATVLGFHAFAAEEVEIAVVEVGLGGRLDATNVVEPLITAVTNVALDHSDYLGSTTAEIAREKAGIMKRGVPFLTSEEDPAILELFGTLAREAGADLHVVPATAARGVTLSTHHTEFRLDSPVFGSLRLVTPLVGRHQARNAALAVAILERLPPDLRPAAAAVRRGVAEVNHPGRDQLETVAGGTWLFDVAHNTAGVRSLVDTIDRLSLPRPLVALVAVLGDKDWRSMLPSLASRSECMVLTQAPSAPPERRWDPAAAADAVSHLAPLRVEEDFLAALDHARGEAGAGTVVVTGSCHTVGSALTVLGLEPLSREDPPEQPARRSPA